MRQKKWFCILIIAWLINTLFCFHSSNPFEKGPYIFTCNGKIVIAPQSLLLLLTHPGIDLGNEPSNPAQQIKYRNRYLPAPKQRLLPDCSKAIDLTVINSLPLAKDQGHQTFKMAELHLPSIHHIDLFRLTPI